MDKDRENRFEDSIPYANCPGNAPRDDLEIKNGYYDHLHFDIISSCSKDSTSSIGSASSSDLLNDATSSSFSSSSSLPNEPLYDFTKLVEELPIKRGLSKYYQGKSQTFTSLSNVRCIEDLSKRARKSSHSPKAIISKKAAPARGSFTSFVPKGGILRPPPTYKTFNIQLI